MLFTTPTQLAVLALVLVAGWFFGLASHPGGRKWRERYTTEREAHAANRKQAEVHLAQQQARAAELERENERLARQATSVRADAPASAPVSAPMASGAARPAFALSRTRRPSRGWFDWS